MRRLDVYLYAEGQSDSEQTQMSSNVFYFWLEWSWRNSTPDHRSVTCAKWFPYTPTVDSPTTPSNVAGWDHYYCDVMRQ